MPFDWEAFWENLARFEDTFHLFFLAGVILGAVILRSVLLFVIRRVVDRVVHGVKKRQSVDDTAALQASPLAAVRIVQRTRTLGSVLGNIVTAAIVLVAIILLFSVFVPNATGAFALITGALGAGLGFGAQNIVKDVLNGLFMVAEDQLGVGDVVDLGPATGVVETVGIRITQVRDVNGTLWYVRNGEILRVGNMSQGWSRIIVDLAVPYDADVDEVQSRMLAAATELATDSKWRGRILDKPELWGLQSISADAVVVRIVMKTRTSERDTVGRELRARLKAVTDELGIKLPSLQSVVATGYDSVMSVAGAKMPRTGSVPAQPPATQKPPRPRKPRGTP